MAENQRDLRPRSIEVNIARFGWHVYVVAGGPSPRFAYTIGLYQKHKLELVLAGATSYSAQDVGVIIRTVAGGLNVDQPLENPMDGQIRVPKLGTFSLRRAHESWAKALMIGALDYFDEKYIPALQIVPDQEHRTIDVPNLGNPLAEAMDPPWQWLLSDWGYDVPERSVAMTNLDALRGGKITEAARWEPDQWELFAGSGPDVRPEDVRAVPLATLLSVDDSLRPVLDLPIGGAIWRENESGSEWHEWTSRQGQP